MFLNICFYYPRISKVIIITYIFHFWSFCRIVQLPHLLFVSFFFAYHHSFVAFSYTWIVSTLFSIPFFSRTSEWCQSIFLSLSDIWVPGSSCEHIRSSIIFCCSGIPKPCLLSIELCFLKAFKSLWTETLFQFFVGCSLQIR